MKPYKVCWTEPAIITLDAILDYFRALDEGVASDLASRLYDAALSLGTLPNRGRPVAGGARELLTVRPYAIRYDVIGERVDILRIRDLRQLPED